MERQLSLLDEAGLQTMDSVLGGLSIRESSRAKRLILQLVPPHRLELVVPKGTRLKVVKRFVDENRQWIDRARSEIDHQYVADRSRAPSHIALPAIGRSFAVEYCAERGGVGSYRAAGDALVVFGAKSAGQDAAPILQQWLMSLGRRFLKPWLQREAQSIGDMPRNIQVRLQQTRWGSCSARGTISLNASLLFLEPRLVRYLMVHELSHIRELNHSSAFWTHVERSEPEFRRLDRELADAWTQIPYWVFVK